MSQTSGQKQVVMVIGAGPTGMTVARGLLDRHISVILLDDNAEGVGGGVRDSIFWDKDKLKLGIMKKYPEVLQNPRFRYFGNVQVGKGGDMTIDQLQKLGPVVLTCGSRGEKKLPVGNVETQGVWDANVLVRILNTRWLLGRTKGQEFEETLEKPYVGKKVALVGMGNVVADMVRHLWILDQREGCGRDVWILVRRTPYANKIAGSEMKIILPYLDKRLFEKEIERILPILLQSQEEIPEAAQLQGGWEDDSEIYQENFQKILKAMHIKPQSYAELPDTIADGASRMRFLFCTQATDIKQVNGKVAGVVLSQKQADGQVSQIQTDLTSVIFSVGSTIDDDLGLPTEDGWLLGDEENPYLIKGYKDIYMAGWTRLPSTGLVGVAVREGKEAAVVIAAEMDAIEDQSLAAQQLELIQNQLEKQLKEKGKADWVNAQQAQKWLDAELEDKAVLSFLSPFG